MLTVNVKSINQPEGELRIKKTDKGYNIELTSISFPCNQYNF